MRKLLIGCALGALVVAAFGLRRLEREPRFRGGSAAAGRRLRDQPDREDLPRVDSKKDIDEMMSLWTAERDLHVRPRADGDGEGRDPEAWLGLTRIQARGALVSRSPGLQAPGDGQRRQGHAALRVPLHRRRHGRGGGRHGRRLRRRQDRRSLADHKDGGKHRPARHLSAGRSATCRRREQQGRRSGDC